MLTKPLPGVMDDPFHPLSQGCVCHLLFNEGAGNLAYDVSGHGNHGTLKNMLPNTQGSKWQGSKFGGALSFDGSNDYVDCGNNASLNITDAITIEAWIYPTGWGEGGYGRIVCKETTGYIFMIQSLDTQLRWYGPSIDHTSNAGSISLNVWQHVAVTYDRQNMYFYVDGVLSGSIQETDAIATNAADVLIGNDAATARTFDGIIDSIRIYNRKLPAQEIKQLYHDPFCNLMKVSAWQNYVPSVGGLSIPVAMHHYEMLRA